MPGYKKKLYYTNLNKFIRDCVNIPYSASVKVVDGYEDPHIIQTSGVKYKGVKEVRVGKLFLLGKIY